AAAMTCLDEARPFRIVLESTAQLLNTRGQRIVTDSGASPDAGKQVLFGDWCPGVHHELLQHGRGLRGQPDLLPAGPEPARPGVEPIAAEGDASGRVDIHAPHFHTTSERSRRNPGTVPGLRTRQSRNLPR